MRIFLIRHAITQQSAKRLIKNDHKDFGLSKEGIAQAIRLRNTFNKIEGKFTVYISPAKRCCQTAKIIFPKLKNEFKTELAFREINKGYPKLIKNNSSFANMTVDEWELKYNNKISNRARNLYKYPSGESVSKMNSRVLYFFNNLISQLNGHDVVIVSHNGPLRAIIAYTLGSLEIYRSVVIDHGCYSELEYDNGSFVLKKMNNI